MRKIDEKRFIEILENNNKKIFEKFDQIDKRFEQVDERFNQMDKKFDKKIGKLEIKMNENMSKLETKINGNVDKLETKIIDNGCYFEVTYGQKIDAIFEKLQINDETLVKEKQDYERFKKRFEHNDTILASHDIRIHKLEQQVNASNF